jgi:hypothetical protein
MLTMYGLLYFSGSVSINIFASGNSAVIQLSEDSVVWGGREVVGYCPMTVAENSYSIP